LRPSRAALRNAYDAWRKTVRIDLEFRSARTSREARKAFRQVDAKKAMTEHEIAQKAFSTNRERLKAERLAREAAGTHVAVKKAKPKG
jgi:hypothetical protein